MKPLGTERGVGFSIRREGKSLAQDDATHADGRRAAIGIEQHVRHLRRLRRSVSIHAAREHALIEVRARAENEQRGHADGGGHPVAPAQTMLAPFPHPSEHGDAKHDVDERAGHEHPLEPEPRRENEPGDRYSHDGAERIAAVPQAEGALGSIVGVALSGLVLLPWLGLKWMLVAGALIDVVLGVAVLARVWKRGEHRLRRRDWVPTAIGVSALVILGASADFNQSVLTSGVYRYGSAKAPQVAGVVVYYHC